MFISRSCCSGTVVEFHWKQMSTLLEEHICCLLFKKIMWRIHVRYKWSIWSFDLFTVLQSSFRTVIQWKSDDKHWSWDKHAHIIFKWIFLNENLYILIQIPPRYIPKSPLTHLPIVLHICVCESDQHRFRQWLVAYSAPSHYLNQCWIIINWTLRNDFQWNFDQKTNVFIQEIAFENVVCQSGTTKWNHYLNQWWSSLDFAYNQCFSFTIQNILKGYFINSLRPIYAYMHHWMRSLLV